MKILTVDIGTGTQDIFLFDSRLALENGLKLVLPSPTMMVHGRIRRATARRSPILLEGRQMGGGPSAWAAEAHARAGLAVFATPDAARTLDDDPARVLELGIKIVSEDEAAKLPTDVERIKFADFDYHAIAGVFERFGTSLTDLEAVAVAVFDHGAAPPGASDRQFRFDYLDERIHDHNSLTAFAYPAGQVPAIMSRLRAVAEAASVLDLPVVVMDTAPAAVLGATFDAAVAAPPQSMILNIGNFHALAFRLGPSGIEGVFEHHTGELDLPKLERLLLALADGSLKHSDVFNDMGHGALVYDQAAMRLGTGDFDVVVTGPRRLMYRSTPAGYTLRLRPYFATPFGDMMLSGCFGLLAATADVLPALSGEIHRCLRAQTDPGIAPWDLDRSS